MRRLDLAAWEPKVRKTMDVEDDMPEDLEDLEEPERNLAEKA